MPSQPRSKPVRPCHARGRKIGEPAVTDERTWLAYERVAMRRG